MLNIKNQSTDVLRLRKKSEIKNPKKKARGKTKPATSEQIQKLQTIIQTNKPTTKEAINKILKSLKLVQAITKGKTPQEITVLINTQPHLLKFNDTEAKSEGKLMGRLATLQKEALIDYLNTHFENDPSEQQKFEDADKIEKELIWGFKYTDGISALSKQPSGKGVGEHIYGIREQVCSKSIVGSNTQWNLIPCPSNDNVAWKIVMIILTETDILEFKNNTKGFEPPDGRDLVTELNLQKSGTTYSGPIQNMIGEFNDIFLKLIKIKLGMIEELNNDKIPNLTEDNEKIISEYIGGIIKYDGTNKNLYPAHKNFMKFYNWKKYCDSKKAKMFWTNEDGAGSKLNDALTKIIEEPLRAMSKAIHELTPAQVKLSDASHQCSLPEESDDKLMDKDEAEDETEDEELYESDGEDIMEID